MLLLKLRKSLPTKLQIQIICVCEVLPWRPWLQWTIFGFKRLKPQVDRNDWQEKYEDTKGVIRRKSKKDRQWNDQTKKNKETNNDLQNITQKTKDRETRTHLTIEGKLRRTGRVAIPVPHPSCYVNPFTNSSTLGLNKTLSSWAFLVFE